MLLFKIRAGLIASLTAGTVVLTEFFNARFAYILFMGAGFLMKAGIERTLYFDLDVTFDFLGNCRGILPEDQSYCLKGQMACDG